MARVSEPGRRGECAGDAGGAGADGQDPAG